MSAIADVQTLDRDNPELRERAAVQVADASRLAITDADSYALAGEHLTGLTSLQREIEGWFEPLVKAAHTLHKTLTSRRKAATDPVEQACTRLRRGMTDWKTEQDRLQREREREAAQALRQAEEERMLREAAALEQAGEATLAAAVVEQAIAAPLPAVTVQSTTPTVEGVTYMTVAKWRLLNLALVPREFLCLDEAKVTAYAKAMKDGAKVPGIQFFTEQVPVVRRRR